MLFLLWGASGSGKTTVLDALAPALTGFTLHDFDEVGVPATADASWRHEMAEAWVRRALGYQAEGRHLLLAGQLPFGELLACPSAPHLDGIAGCLLDCDDYTRVNRLKERGDTMAATQDMLCWAAWLRMHARDPQWHPNVVVDGASDMVWERWRDWTAGDPRWSTHRLDTTGLTVTQTAERLVAWIDRERTRA